MKLIYIEDDDVLRTLLVRQLEQFEDWHVHTAGSIEEALAKLEKNGHDCIVLDIGLPDAAGGDGIRKLRSKFDLPIVVYSGSLTHDTEEEVRALGVHDIITKGDVDAWVIKKSVLLAIERFRTEKSRIKILDGLDEINQKSEIRRKAVNGGAHA